MGTLICTNFAIEKASIIRALIIGPYRII